jgi:hypothetical protein
LPGSSNVDDSPRDGTGELDGSGTFRVGTRQPRAPSYPGAPTVAIYHIET